MGMVPPIQITADEVNQIVHAYLKDSGFEHTAFSLRAEGRLDQSPHFDRHVPRGELVELLTKALLYIEVETHCKGEGLISDCKAPFRLLKRHACASDPLDDVNGASGNGDKNGKQTSAPTGSDLTDAQLKRKADTPADGDVHDRRVKRSAEPESGDGEPMVLDSPEEGNSAVAGPSNAQRPVSPVSIARGANGTAQDASKKLKPYGPQDGKTPKEAIVTLKGHKGQVFVGAWNPTRHTLFATGSKDATARIWDLPDPPKDPKKFAGGPTTDPLVLPHFPIADPGDITCCDWSPDGMYFTTGSYDAILRIYTFEGELYFRQPQQKGPIFAVKFSRSGRWLLSASLDGTACVWDVSAKKLHQEYKAHKDTCLDGDWLSDNTFATCGADQLIHIMRIGEDKPIHTFQGHEDEINQVKFNQSKTLLASCSDDQTARLWSLAKLPGLETPAAQLEQDVVVLSGHEDSVGCIGWCPQPSQGQQDILASCSFNGTVRLWDGRTGASLRAIADHEKAVYTLTFSPEGRFLATGSGDGFVHIYDIISGQRVWAWYSGSDRVGIYEICWQQWRNINRIALCLESYNTAIVDLTKVPSIKDVAVASK